MALDSEPAMWYNSKLKSKKKEHPLLDADSCYRKEVCYRYINRYAGGYKELYERIYDLKSEIQEPDIKLVTFKMPYPLYKEMRHMLIEQNATMSETMRGMAARYVMEHRGGEKYSTRR